MNNLVHGSGGGKGGGDYRAPVEDPNTLQSKSVANLVDIISEGKIKGLVGVDDGDQRKGVYLNETPLMTEDGTITHEGVSISFRNGTPDQSAIPFPGVESEISVSAEVTHDYPKNSGSGDGSITRTITNPNATSCRLKIRVSQLTEQNVENGDLHGTSVQIAIYLNGQQVNLNTIEGKTVSPYERSYKFNLIGNAPWNIRVQRITPDNDKANIQNDTFWSSYTEIVDAKMIYPDTAVVAMRGDAASFGNSIPRRAYLGYGIECRVPSNYDVETRAYTGIWDGTFKTEWTDNPAWIFYDIVVSDRYGLGQFVSLTDDTRYYLYDIAQYCDQLVPSGFGTMEPRYTFNYYITSRDDAIDVLRAFASVFRGFVFWGAGNVIVRADQPRDPIKNVSASNVEKGEFHYSSTSYSGRHSVAIVTWNDMSDFGRPTREVIEDPELIDIYGWKPLELTAYGCTSRGQAHRMGKWALFTEQMENEICNYTAGEDHFDVLPGDIIRIADPHYQQARMGGRLTGISDTEVMLDSEFEIESGKSYRIHITMPDYSIHESDITNVAGTYTSMILATPMSDTPLPNAQWIIAASDLEPRLFRVLNKTEPEAGKYNLECLFYDPDKYAKVEQSVTFDPVPYTRPVRDLLAPPTNLNIVESSYFVNGLPRQRFTVSWTPAADPNVASYIIQVQAPAGTTTNYDVGQVTTYDFDAINEGQYTVRVQSRANDSRTSDWAIVQKVALGKNIPPGKCTNLQAKGKFKSVELTWINPNDTDLQHIFIYKNSVDNLGTSINIASIKGTSYTDLGLGSEETAYYWVQAQDISGNLGEFNSNLGTAATSTKIEFGDVGENVIQPSNLIPELLEPIEEIPTIKGNTYPLKELITGVDAYTGKKVSEGLQDVVTRQLQDVADGLLELTKDTDIQRGINRDVTITYDPDQGRYIIRALETLKDGSDLTLKEAELRLDAQNAEIQLKASVNYVDSQVASAIASFSPVYVYPFNTSLDGWTSPYDLIHNGAGYVTLSGDITPLYMDSPDISYQGEDGASITLRGRRTPGNTGSFGEGKIYWKTISHDYEAQYSAPIVEPSNLEDMSAIRIDMSNFNDYKNGTITGIRIQIGASGSSFDIDEIEIGKHPQDLLLTDIQARLSSAEIDISGLDAEIQIKANKTDLDATNSRLTIAEGKIDVNAGRIDLKAEQTDLDNTDGRVTTAEQEINALQGAISEQVTAGYATGEDVKTLADSILKGTLFTDDSKEFTRANFAIARQEISAVATDLEAEATSRVTLATQVDNNTSKIQQEQIARSDADEAIAQDITILQTNIDSNTATIQTETETRATEDEALSSRIDAVVSSTGANTATIQNEIQSRTTADEALSQDISTLQTTVSGNTSAIQTEQTARSDADTALSTQINTLQSTVGTNTSSIQTNASAISSTDGKVEALYEVKTQVESDGKRYVAGFGVRADPTGSEFAILADRFLMAQPSSNPLDSVTPVHVFTVGRNDKGQNVLYLDGNLLATGVITGDKINADSQITLANGAILIDGVNGLIRITDPDNLTTGNYILMSSGALETYRYISGAYIRDKRLTRIETDIVPNGGLVELPGFWKNAPNIMVSPSTLQVFDKTATDQNQSINVFASNISYNDVTQKCSFIPRAELVLEPSSVDLIVDNEDHFPFIPGGESGAEDTPYTRIVSGANIPVGTNSINIKYSAIAQVFFGYGVNYDQGRELKVTVTIKVGGVVRGSDSIIFPQSSYDLRTSADGKYIDRNKTLSFPSIGVSSLVSLEFYVETTGVTYPLAPEAVSATNIGTSGWFKISTISYQAAGSTSLAEGTVNYIAIGE